MVCFRHKITVNLVKTVHVLYQGADLCPLWDAVLCVRWRLLCLWDISVCHCITISLYHCITMTVSLYDCITVSLYHYITISLYHYAFLTCSYPKSLWQILVWDFKRKIRPKSFDKTCTGNMGLHFTECVSEYDILRCKYVIERYFRKVLCIKNVDIYIYTYIYIYIYIYLNFLWPAQFRTINFVENLHWFVR